MNLQIVSCYQSIITYKSSTLTYKAGQKQPHKIIDKKDVQKKGTFPQNLAPVAIKYPFLWLSIIALIIYIPTLNFGFTELDDSIFIREFHEYNENLANLFTSFHRGLFDATKDPYFRPLFLDSIILNYQFAKQEIFGYHVINVMLHISCVVLAYNLFVKLRIRRLHSFLLALAFAVHPVLTQTVAWIPGRNDTLLALFTFAFFNFAIDYSDMGKLKDILLSVLFLLMAFFTKETAVFIPFVTFIMLVFIIGNDWRSRSNIILYSSWVACFLIWFIVRSQASNINATSGTDIGNMVSSFIHRLPLIPQYIGKIILPVNLSNFPMQEQTSNLYGYIAIALIAASLYFSKEVNWKKVICGAIIFFIFLIPALLIPNNLNEQTFEHRLYLPIIGMLIVLSETTIFKRVIDSNTLLFSGILCALLAIGNFVHQRCFKDPYSFWTTAVATSPNSAYANMMLGAREDNLEKSYHLFRKAYSIDSTQKYLNFYYGKMLQMQDSVLQSEKYLLAEKQRTDFVECDFYLARVAMTKNDTTGTINYLKNYLTRMPASEPANNNLLLTYINRRQFPEAKSHATHMQQIGLKVPDQIQMILSKVPQ